MASYASLKAAMRAHLLATQPLDDYPAIEGYLNSPQCGLFMRSFETRLKQEFAAFTSAQVRPLLLDDLTPAIVNANASTAANTAAAATHPVPVTDKPDTDSAPDPVSGTAVVDTVAAVTVPLQKPEQEQEQEQEQILEPVAPVASAASLESTEATAPAATAPPVAPTPPPAGPALSFRLRNARAGERYAHALEPQAAGGQAVPVVHYQRIVLPEALGMIADLADGCIKGTPAQAGEFDITVTYSSNAPDAAERQASVTLIVNPDPRTMWQNLPSDQSDRYWKADQACQWIAGDDANAGADDAADAGASVDVPDVANHGANDGASASASASASAGWRLIAASKRGRSHAHVGSFRDDDFGIAQLPSSGWQVAVVADGAGSARHSRRGAQLICEQALAHLRRTLDGDEGRAIDVAAAAYQRALGAAASQSGGLAGSQAGSDTATELARKTLHARLFVSVGHAAYYGVKAITQEALDHADDDPPAAIRDYASTALIAACKRYPFGTLYVAYWVGDGAVGVYGPGHGITLLGEADGGEYSGQTRFLDAAEVTQEALQRRTRFTIVDHPAALVLMTDGVSDPRFETDARLARATAWDALWQDLERNVGLSTAGPGSEQKLLDWLDFWSAGNHDDRTIVLVY